MEEIRGKLATVHLVLEGILCGGGVPAVVPAGEPVLSPAQLPQGHQQRRAVPHHAHGQAQEERQRQAQDKLSSTNFIKLLE